MVLLDLWDKLWYNRDVSKREEEKVMRQEVKWYWYGDCRCIVGTTLAFADEVEMRECFGDDVEFVEVETPDDAGDDMVEY